MVEVAQARPRRVAKPALAVPPNVADLEAYRRSFSWTAMQHALEGQPDLHGLNIAHVAVDRWADGPRASHVAIRWRGRNGARRDLSYRDLSDLSSRFANVLDRLGLVRGNTLFVLTGRIPALYAALLGALKHGVVVSPLFSAFGPEPIRTRLEIGNGRALVTTTSLYRKKVAPIRDRLPALEVVLLVRDDDLPELPAGTFDLDELLRQADDTYVIEPTRPEDPALLHFTSGTTGRPKGALHVHQAVVAHYTTGLVALDFHPEDVFWCTADPGWVTGTSYGIIAPLTHGITAVVDEADFDPDRWYGILEEERVTVWYTAPTAIRMMMKAGTELVRRRRFPRLRFIASVGEPLNPEAVYWGIDAFGLPIHDNWWQTETGGIMIANIPSMEIRPGSMGKPLPGVDAVVIRRTDAGSEVCPPNTTGELALKVGWPSMFRGYLGEEERYRMCFTGDWYLTGDLARQDEDGYFWFIGRADDVIKSAGHLIGPFEVESALMEHPAVAEAAVIGKPDPMVGEVVKAFIALKRGVGDSEATRRDLLGFARTRLGPSLAPKEIEFRAVLPRTRSGKIMRRLLKAQELGLPTGDLSTLEAG